MTQYCKNKNLPYSVAEIREMINECSICIEVKPRFFKPPSGKLIYTNAPWQRLSIDFVGPLQSRTINKYILVVVDKCSRFPFAFPCAEISTSIVIKHLSNLFSLFGNPLSIHNDRGTQFESKELSEFLLKNGIAKSRTTPYRPQGNGQFERINGTILKAINLTLRDMKLDKIEWEVTLKQALTSIRTLLSTATNTTPHDRLFKFPRSSITGTD